MFMARKEQGVIARPRLPGAWQPQIFLILDCHGPRSVSLATTRLGRGATKNLGVLAVTFFRVLAVQTRNFTQQNDLLVNVIKELG